MKKQIFNEGWLFELEPVYTRPYSTVSTKCEDLTGKAALNYNDNSWEHVTLPHDWCYSLPMKKEYDRGHGHYAVNNIGMDHADHAICPEPVSTIGWYRRKIKFPEDVEGKRVFLHFDGIFRDSMLFINGQKFLQHESGYAPFSADITNHIRPGQDNLIAVRCDASMFEGWWYEGAGIYRNVHISVCEPLYVRDNGVTIRTDNSGAVALRAEIENKYEEAVKYSVRASIKLGGEIVASAVNEEILQESYSPMTAELSLRVDSPKLWELDSPTLYECVIEILRGGEVIDSHTESFGFREIKFDADKGFFLNGRRVQINGACVHQDLACVGVALTDDLQEFKIRRLKEMGCNAYRSSHHAPTRALVEVCDRLGMLFMDETRMFGSTPECLSQLEALVRRDRNSPSVIIWSIGNEEQACGIQNRVQGTKMARDMMRVVRALDPTRPVTYGGNNGGRYEGINEAVDVRGINYIRIMQQDDFAGKYHADHPTQPIISTEETSGLYHRGSVKIDIEGHLVSGYDENTAIWGSTAEGFLRYYDAHPYIAGGFIWTGFDYTGEPTPYSYYNSVTSFGAIDLCGFPKEIYHYYRSWWRDEPHLYLMPHWNHKDGETVRVIAYTNCPEVELFLNGRSLGKQTVERFGYGEWQTAFESGRLEAVAYKDGKEILRTVNVTAGEPASLDLRREDYASGETVIMSATVVDSCGNPVPDANSLIRFKAKGAKIIGVGNGDPRSYEPSQFKPIKERIELGAWYSDGEAFDGDADRSTTLYDWSNEHDHELVYEEANPSFFDRRRIVFNYKKYEKRTKVFTCSFEAEPGEYLLELERVNGIVKLEHNGEVVADDITKGAAYGLPQAFPISVIEGENRLTLTLTYTDRPGTNPGIFGKTTLIREVEPEWLRRAYMGKCLVMARKVDECEPVITAEIVKE